MSGRIVLKDKDPEPNHFGYSPKYIAGFEIWEFYHNDNFPNAPGEISLDIICTPDVCIDGHWLTWKGDRIWNGYTVPKEVIGVTSHLDRVEPKTYELAKKFAEDKAKSSHLQFKDETSRAKESPLASV